MDEDLVDIILQHPSIKTWLHAAFRPHKDDLERIVKLLNLTGAKKVLEFGSGWSTLVICAWVNRHDAFCESLEADPFWYMGTMTALDSVEDLSPRLKNGDLAMPMHRTQETEPHERRRLLFSPVCNGSTIDRVRFTYQCLQSPDFIYVDGPALHGRRLLVDNVLSLDRSNPMAFLVDGRWPQAWAIKQEFLDYTALISTSVSLICHRKFSEAIEWFRSNVDCVVNPSKVVLEQP